MREDSEYKRNDLHWHNGSTCHGSPTLEACINYAKKRQWTGKVLEKTDKYRDGTEVKCYSLISDGFEHWGRQGKFVATLELEMKVTTT